MARPGQRGRWWLLGSFAAVWLGAGCWQLPSAHTISRNYSQGEAPIDPPGEGGHKFDDVARGGQLFKMYCGSCHNARALGERPFSNYDVALAHMREQAYLTGKEYRQLVHFLRRWHDVGPATPEMEPSPKRFIYGQPIPELRPKPTAPNPPAPPIPEAKQEANANANADPWRAGER